MDSGSRGHSVLQKIILSIAILIGAIWTVCLIVVFGLLHSGYKQCIYAFGPTPATVNLGYKKAGLALQVGQYVQEQYPASKYANDTALDIGYKIIEKFPDWQTRIGWKSPLFDPLETDFIGFSKQLLADANQEGIYIYDIPYGCGYYFKLWISSIFILFIIVTPLFLIWRKNKAMPQQVQTQKK